MAIALEIVRGFREAKDRFSLQIVTELSPLATGQT
jgi:hypothetical protein